MISIAEAKEIIDKNTPSAGTETISLFDAGNRWLAADIFATEPSPRFNNSAMDGFAFCWDDIESAMSDGVVRLPLVGESRAGIPAGFALKAGSAIQISTGGLVPVGADTVIPLEKVVAKDEHISFSEVPVRWQHVRHAGEEFSAGSLLLKARTRLTPPSCGLLASQGINSVPVFCKPRVAVLLTGTELVDHSANLQDGQIRDSNNIMLREAALLSGAEMVMSKRVVDDLELTINALEEAAAAADVIVFSGGVSVGPHDLVKPAAAASGFETLFWRVNQRPGKPLLFARKKNKLLFGLPGNPVSAYMCFNFYVRPLLSELAGGQAFKKNRAIWSTPMSNTLPRAQMFRVKLDNPGEHPLFISPLKRQASHMLTSLTEADGFVVLQVGAKYAAGDSIEVILF